MKIGLIQVRGLGDILIALPIARYYHDRGHEIHWPIMEGYMAAFRKAVPWVHWSSITPDQAGAYLYATPKRFLQEKNVDKILCLYHHLSSEPGFSPEPIPAAILKFDQYKYAVANVPFIEKWSLSRCIVRDHEREQALFDKLVTQERYLVLHRQGSDEVRSFDTAAALNRGYQIVEISEMTDCFFDWLLILEKASILVMIDSVFSNLVDQFGLGAGAAKLFLRRSHNQIAWTPVMVGNWQYL